jgi:hypothetical protein
LNGYWRYIGIVALALASVAAFVAGTSYEKHRLQISQFVHRLAAAAPGVTRIAVADKAPAHIALAHVDPIKPEPRSRRTFDTELLPLVIETLAMPSLTMPSLTMPSLATPSPLGVHVGMGGGIAVVDDRIIIVDVKGAVFAVESKGETARELALPPIPHHAEDYEKFARKPINANGFEVNTGFRVHDVEARKEPGGVRLFVAYERFLLELRTTALAVSTILLAEKDLRPLTPGRISTRASRWSPNGTRASPAADGWRSTAMICISASATSIRTTSSCRPSWRRRTRTATSVRS